MNELKLIDTNLTDEYLQCCSAINSSEVQGYADQRRRRNRLIELHYAY